MRLAFPPNHLILGHSAVAITLEDSRRQMAQPVPSTNSAHQLNAKRTPPVAAGRNLRHLVRDPLGYFQAITAEYGDIVCYRPAPDTAYLINHPDYVRHVLVDNNRNYSKETHTNQVFNKVVAEGLLTTEGEIWRRQRRMMQPAFHRTRLELMDRMIADATGSLLESWRKAAALGPRSTRFGGGDRPVRWRRTHIAPAARPRLSDVRSARGWGMRKRVIRAGEIEIEDSEGRVRARFGVTNDDLPFMSFYGADEKLRARFGVQPDGSAGLAIADDDGKVRATFGLFSDGSASMAMVDRNGKVRAKFGLGTEGSPTLALRNKDGELGFVYSLAQQGSPTISLQDEDGKVRARIGLAAEGSPILRLLNKEGELRAIMGLTADGTPVLQFLDEKGEPEWTVPSSFSPPVEAAHDVPPPTEPEARGRG